VSLDSSDCIRLVGWVHAADVGEDAVHLRHDFLFLALGSVRRAWLEAELLITITILYILCVVTITGALLHVDATVLAKVR